MFKSKNTISTMKQFCCAVLTLGLFGSQINVSHAQGLPLTPGNIVSGPGFGPLGGTTITSISIPFASTSFTGILTSSVIGGDVSNPLGGLTFTYQYSINTGPDSSGGISLGGFGSFLTDVGYQTPATGVTPAVENRSTTGDNIDFFFSSIPVGQSSALLVVQTSAQTFGINTSTVLDSTGSPFVNELAPVSVPEPTSVVCFLLGLGVLASTRRLKKC